MRWHSGSVQEAFCLSSSWTMSWQSPRANPPTWDPGSSADALPLCADRQDLLGFCRCVSPCPPPSLPAPEIHPFRTCLCFQPGGWEQGTASGTRPSALLLLSFIIQGLARDRPRSQLKQALMWEKTTRAERPLGSGPDYLMLTSPGQVPISRDRDPLTSCWALLHHQIGQRWWGKMPL